MTGITPFQLKKHLPRHLQAAHPWGLGSALEIGQTSQNYLFYLPLTTQALSIFLRKFTFLSKVELPLAQIILNMSHVNGLTPFPLSVSSIST